MNLNKIDTNRIKFEARVAAPPDPPKSGSAFGRFLRSFGALAAPVGYAASFFFPPAALIGAASYGLGQFGNYRDSSKKQDINSNQLPQILFPAVTTPAGGPGRPGGSPEGHVDPMNVIANRQAATNDMMNQIGDLE